jgi:hypothetical protein
LAYSVTEDHPVEVRRTGHLTGLARTALVPASIGGSTLAVAANVAIVAAAGLVAVSGVLHLQLWSSGYSTIPTIGPMFLFQGVASIALAAAVALLRRAWTALAGATMMLATIGGLLISVNFGLFGFQDSLGAHDATLSLAVEAAAAALLLAGAATLALARTASTGRG